MGAEGSQQLEDWKLMSITGMEPVCPESLKHISSFPRTLQAFCRREGIGSNHHASVHSSNSQTSHEQNVTGAIFAYV